jgi:hypothetical protein
MAASTAPHPVVAQHHNERHPQELGAVFEGCQQIRIHDVARDAHNEEIARPLVERKLRRHT